MSFTTDNYQIDFLDVNDADAILIRCYNGQTPFIILIDSGNINDSTIVKNKLKYTYKSQIIDLAICTHPDKDHFGGFFNLLDDEEITIKEFWLIDPAKYLNEEDIKYYKTEESARKAVRKIFDRPNDSSINLITKLNSTTIPTFTVKAGDKHETIPIRVMAPDKEYYGEIVKQMVSDYGVNAYDESDTSVYDENALPVESEAKSVIDVDDDQSPYNASSVVLLFEPGDGRKFLFTGDANCASLSKMIDDYGEDVKNVTILKVPHHGSKHNLTTEIIESLSPKLSIVSAKGTKKHPSSAIVYWLSKYGNVYSTHKNGSLLWPKRANQDSAKPLKEKQSTKR
jgi:beta-lactamase superfamily II metal-dependent hydrolase